MKLKNQNDQNQGKNQSFSNGKDKESKWELQSNQLSLNKYDM